MPGRKAPAETRFAEKVRKSDDGCWIWTASTRYGYGHFSDYGRSLGAHRWSYEHFIGPIPDGMQLDHLCRVRACVNPEHLEPVTARQNLLRASGTWGGRNIRKTHCPSGHPLPEPQQGTLRYCKECKRVKALDYYYRKRGEVLH